MLFREWIRTIKRTFNRFFSILVIVALGTAFFSGIRSAEPDMRLSGDAFYDAREMADLRVLGTLGMTDRDVERIGALPGVALAEGDYFKDLIGLIGEKELNLRVMSISSQVNIPELVEGRMPEAADECLLDEVLLIMGEYQIGDVIEFDPEETEDVLGENRFTVTGFMNHPYFLSLARGSSSAGNGSLDGLVLVNKDSFTQDCYTDVLLRMEGSDEVLCYSEEYEAIAKLGKDGLKTVEDELCDARYHEIVDEAQEEVDDAKKELADAKQELEDAEKEADEELAKAEQELIDAEKELEDAKKEIADGEEEIAKAKRKIASNEKDLEKAKKETADGEKQITEAREELEAQKETFAEQKAQVEEARAEVDAGAEALAAAEEELAAGAAELDAQEAALAAAREELEESLAALIAAKDYMSEEEYNASYAQIEAGLEEVAAGYAQIEAGRAQIASGEEELAVQRAVLEASEAEVAEAEAQIAEGEAALEAAEEEVAAGENKIAEAKAEIAAGEKEIAKAKRTIAQNERDLADAKEEVEKGEQEIADGWAEYEDAKAEAEEKIADAKQEIADAEQKLADAQEDIDAIEEPEWYIQDRGDFSPVYDEYDRDASNIGALGHVFPAIFFLVAMLISLTTMTRMVQEERMQIGTLKALGFDSTQIAGKYIGYGLCASVLGGFAGVLIGGKILPYVIIKTYAILYTAVTDIRIPYQWGLGLAAIAIAAVCILIATYVSCRNVLREVPAQLMRPEAPKAGKKIFLEKFRFWQKVPFTRKSTVRNLVRYRKRLFMTLFGIAGCMGLVIVGFGLLDSISAISERQFVDLHVYDAMVAVDDRTSEAKQRRAEEAIASNEMTLDYLYARQETVDVVGDITFTGMIFVPREPENLGTFIHIRERGGSFDYVLEDDTVVIAEKTAAKLKVGAGDTFSLRLDDETEVPLTVAGVTENYYENYIYMTPALYEKIMGEAPEYNSCMLMLGEGDRDAYASQILKQDSVVLVEYSDDIRDTINDMLSNMDAVVMVIVLGAALLAFVVIYNLNNINIGERKRELATLKVLGFYDPEVAAYVFRENVILTFLGILLGLAFGKLLHAYVITTVEVELIMFGREIRGLSYLWSALLTFLFSMVVNAIMYFQLKKIDMVESLKSVE